MKKLAAHDKPAYAAPAFSLAAVGIPVYIYIPNFTRFIVNFPGESGGENHFFLPVRFLLSKENDDHAKRTDSGGRRNRLCRWPGKHWIPGMFKGMASAAGRLIVNGPEMFIPMKKN